MLIAVVFALVGSTIYLGVAGTLALESLALSDAYSAATDAAQRAAYVAVYDLDIGGLMVATFMSRFLGSFFIFVAGWVMLKGTRIFSRAIAYLGMVSGILGTAGFFQVIVAPAVLGTAGFFSSFLLIPWGLAVGSKLYKLGRE